MSANSDLIDLYSQKILGLAADIPHRGRLEGAQASVKKRAPLCGSTVTVDLDLDEAGRIARFGQDVKACALGQAAAALMGRHVIGRTRAEIETARDALRAMLKEGGPPPGDPFDGYEVLTPAREYRNRHASIMLSLEATADAVAEAERAACA
ncbi:Putative iron-sulfur cluster assembly scaffold protein for SUF system, SufE2 [Roseibacterium elongatum DSM 19469]|uniref:Putative iron-sulfur cluster assembly scaffold protein for SUF system, SufE2 n=1 Tax=Roseicyclus elongatus DSM 19469 TaxID=1294273 RepID=W8SR24_9RHOB|nr:iron-sulfur cluster scaffold-like protein [Roseibacterium elongatum]AHM04955.1 Putative iron-sulfur cluster assembly scaffold protein for SUF system, SufE2 [Roseibacterium elongatum DSM 19469]